MVTTRLFEFVSMDFLGFRRKYYSELVRERWDRLLLCGGEGRRGGWDVEGWDVGSYLCIMYTIYYCRMWISNAGLGKCENWID